MKKASAVRGSGFGLAVVIVGLLNRAFGVHVDPEIAVGLTGALIGGGGFIVHHGGLSGIWRLVVHGQPPG